MKLLLLGIPGHITLMPASHACVTGMISWYEAAAITRVIKDA